MSEAAGQSRGSYLADDTKEFTRQDVCCHQVSLKVCFILKDYCEKYPNIKLFLNRIQQDCLEG